MDKKVEQDVANGRDELESLAEVCSLLYPLSRVVILINVIPQHGFGSYGAVRSLPGFPKMFDYELRMVNSIGRIRDRNLPQEPGPQVGAFTMEPHIFRWISGTKRAAWHPKTTGLICPTPEEMEPEATEALKQELGKTVLMVG